MFCHQKKEIKMTDPNKTKIKKRNYNFFLFKIAK